MTIIRVFQPRTEVLKPKTLRDGGNALQSNEGRLIHHHLPRAFVPSEVQKNIYVIRNPYDVCVSYYHHLKVK